jgi:hypothetical protein
MPPITHIFATVPEGRECPIPPSEANAPGAALLVCRPGKVYRLPYTTFTRRRVLGGDLVLSNRRGTKVDAAEHARSDEPLELDETGAIATENVQGRTEATTEGSVKPMHNLSDDPDHRRPRKG